VEELRGAELEQQAIAHDELAAARSGNGSAGALERGPGRRAARPRERAAALSAQDGAEAEQHLARAAAAAERARAREQRALAEQALTDQTSDETRRRPTIMCGRSKPICTTGGPTCTRPAPAG
jgi:hypothetical protein